MLLECPCSEMPDMCQMGGFQNEITYQTRECTRENVNQCVPREERALQVHD